MKKNNRSKQRANWVAGIICLVVLTIFYSVREQRFIRQSAIYDVISGHTMGTVYEIKLAYSGITEPELAELRKAIADELDSVERELSLYIADSEISRFNRIPAGQPFPAGESFVFVAAQALRFAELTQGAFDPTIAPLVNLWGFGREGRRREPPDSDSIEEVLAFVGWDKIAIEPGVGMVKLADRVELDFGAIAKGYGVDRVAQLLRNKGVGNFMVEIGGDIYVSGLNSAEDLWRIGIDAPEIAALPGRHLRGIVNVSNLAIATSGGYRNFFKSEDGSLYSHIIDPRTGRPTRDPRSSITVVAETCLAADALATALFVLGEDEGLGLVETIDGVEVLFITIESEDIVRESASTGFFEKTSYIRVSR